MIEFLGVRLFQDANATFSEEDIKKYEDKISGYEGGNWVNQLIKNNAPRDKLTEQPGMRKLLAKVWLLE